MNPIVLKYLEEVARVKTEVKAKQERKERELLKKKFDKPVGIYYEDGEPHLNLPAPPSRPEPSDCCNNGCSPCVFDVYKDDLHDYEDLVARLRRDLEEARRSSQGNCKAKVPSITSECLRKLTQPDDRPLSVRAYRPFLIERVSHVTRNAVVVIGKVPYTNQGDERVLGVTDGEHVLLRADIDGSVITKAFTPISHPEIKGMFKIMIKIYPNQAMSRYIRSIAAGDSLMLRGPIHSGYSYIPNSVTTFIIVLATIITATVFLNPVFNPSQTARLIMLAAGSGIAPMYQILMKLRDHRDSDKARVDLVYSNSTEEDIWLKEELAEIAADLEGLRVWHVITRPPFPPSPSSSPSSSPTHIPSPSTTVHILPSAGRLGIPILGNLLPPASDLAMFSYRILICGPASFNENMRHCMNEMGYREDAVFVFK